jgi:hypothetical protein
LEVDPQVLLCLLAVRQLGGKSVPAKQDLFTKELKAPLKTAQENGWLRADKATVLARPVDEGEVPGFLLPTW